LTQRGTHRSGIRARLRPAALVAALVAALAALLPLALPPRGLAAGPPGAALRLEARAAFGGHFKYGEWLPVFVYIENGGADTAGEIQVRVTATQGGAIYAAPVELPAGARKRVPVYVLPNNFSRQLDVQFVDAGGQAVSSTQVAVQPNPNINLLVGILAAERGALSLISAASDEAQSRPKVLIDLALDELPDRTEGLGSLDCIVLNDVDTSLLTPGQQAALAAWVQRGGRLVVGGGAGAQRTAAGLPGALLPLRPQGAVEVASLEGLVQIVTDQPVRVPGPFLLATGEPGEGHTLAVQGGRPLVRERSVGQGTVDWVALDLAVSPFDAWAGALGFWRALVIDRSPYPINLPPDLSLRQMHADQMSYTLANMPSLALPSVQWVAAMLGAYILLVGPVNYLVLRWRQRLHLAWATIPALTLFFAGGAFGLAYAMRGTDLIVNKIALVTQQPGGTAFATSYVGLFSPERKSYEIEVQGGGLVGPLAANVDPFGAYTQGAPGDMAFVQGEPARVRGLQVNQWSMQTFMTEDLWADFGAVSPDLRLEGSALVGTVRNETERDLNDVVILLGDQFTRLGDLAAGQSAAVRFDLARLGQQWNGAPISYRLYEQAFQEPGGPSREVQRKQQVLDVLFNIKFSTLSSVRPAGDASQTQELILLAWFDESPPSLRIDGRPPAEQTTALLYAPLAYALPKEGKVALPPGFVPGRLAEMPTEGGPCGSSEATGVYIGRGTATFEFQLPAAARDLQVSGLTLALGADGGWQQPPEVALYAWPTGEWLVIDDPILGDNRIASAGDLVSGNGLVRVRLSAPVGSGCLYVHLGVEGTR
jgi:hypothetical protein